MKMKQVKELTAEELDKQLTDLKSEKLNLQIQSKTGQLENPARMKEIRKTIARIKTEKRARA